LRTNVFVTGSVVTRSVVTGNGIIRPDEPSITQFIIVAVLALFCASAGQAQIRPSPILSDQLLAQASPDECFAGIGQLYPPLQAGGTCPSGSIPKRNQAYVWGLAQSGTKAWFGTAANVLCLAGGRLGGTQPYQKQSWVCEFGASQYGRTYHLPAASGDWRPPKAYVYDTAGAGLTDVTPADSKFTHTAGIRSAGTLGDTVFLAGPALSAQGVNFFAFSSSAQKYLGSCQASMFSDVRHFIAVNNVLYAGVGNAGGGGSVIRWNGTPSQPFDNTSSTCGFEVVGILAGEAGDLTAYGPNSDRIAVSAWPNPGGAGIYISPAMNVATGLTSSDASHWGHIWRPSMYEPDAVTATTYACGGLAYWNGALYFGTMHKPGEALVAHENAYGQSGSYQQHVEVFQSTYRATTIWQIQNAETKTPVIQLLYGEPALPKFDPGSNSFLPASTGFTPLYGPSGFGNIYNNYAWTAAIFQNRLFFGTMDWSYLNASGVLPPPRPGFVQPSSAVGADLWRFDAPGPAVAENINGLGNLLNYGLRCMITSSDGQALLVGTANPMNLATGGGWELQLLQLQP
jgi:hypothetical protein